jgi:antitoxin VapB
MFVDSPSIESAPVRVAVFKNRSNQAVRIPVEFSFPGATELEMRRVGDMLILRRPKPSWDSFFDLPAAGHDFLAERPDVVESRPFDFSDDEER